MVYESIRSLDDFDPWLTRVRNFPAAVLDMALRQIPPEWIAGDEEPLERMLEALLRRKERIADLLVDCRQAPGNPFPRWVD
jgi:hypothetical protein